MSNELDKAFADIEGGVSFELCGCKSKVVKTKDGSLGKSVKPCEAHTMQIIANNLEEVAQMFAHMSAMKLKAGNENAKP